MLRDYAWRMLEVSFVLNISQYATTANQSRVHAVIYGYWQLNFKRLLWITQYVVVVLTRKGKFVDHKSNWPAFFFVLLFGGQICVCTRSHTRQHDRPPDDRTELQNVRPECYFGTQPEQEEEDDDDDQTRMNEAKANKHQKEKKAMNLRVIQRSLTFWFPWFSPFRFSSWLEQRDSWLLLFVSFLWLATWSIQMDLRGKLVQSIFFSVGLEIFFFW